MEGKGERAAERRLYLSLFWKQLGIYPGQNLLGTLGLGIFTRTCFNSSPQKTGALAPAHAAMGFFRRVYIEKLSSRLSDIAHRRAHVSRVRSARRADGQSRSDAERAGSEGDAEGDAVGMLVGVVEGDAEGDAVGMLVGVAEGDAEGEAVAEEIEVGFWVAGCCLQSSDGERLHACSKARGVGLNNNEMNRCAGMRMWAAGEQSAVWLPRCMYCSCRSLGICWHR